MISTAQAPSPQRSPKAAEAIAAKQESAFTMKNLELCIYGQAEEHKVLKATMDQEFVDTLLEDAETVNLLSRATLAAAESQDGFIDIICSSLKRLSMGLHDSTRYDTKDLFASYIHRSIESIAQCAQNTFLNLPLYIRVAHRTSMLYVSLLKHWREDPKTQRRLRTFQSTGHSCRSMVAKEDVLAAKTEEGSKGPIKEFDNLRAWLLMVGLIGSFKRHLRWHIEANPMLHIRDRIIRSLPTKSRRDFLDKPDNLFGAWFNVKWQEKAFLSEMEEGALLKSLLVLTGSSDTAWASTVEEYMISLWPGTAPKLLDLITNRHGLETATSSSASTSVVLESGLTAILREPAPDYIQVHVIGPVAEIIEIGQQLAWLSATLRSRSGGMNLVSSQISFDASVDGTFQISLRDTVGLAPSLSDCWYTLFPSRVLTEGFPIPLRYDIQEKGLEISFTLMLYLSSSTYELPWGSGTILVGEGSILIPVFSRDNYVQWHLVKIPKGGDLKFLGNISLPKPIKVPLTYMTSMRTFLGFCEYATIHLGAQGPGMPQLKSSRALDDKSGFELSREISFQLSASSPVAVGGQLGFKANLPKRQALNMEFGSIDLDQALWNARDNSTLMYDTSTNIAWLVPEASVMLHMARQWLSNRGDIPQPIRDNFPCAEAESDGGGAAFEAMKARLNLMILPAEQSLSGVPFYFRDLIKNLLRQFHIRKQVASVQAHALDTQKLFHKFWTSSTLRGWDVLDIVLGKPFPVRRKVDLEAKRAGHWNGLTFQNPELLVLLCSNLGSPIRPHNERVCKFWWPIPSQSYYMIASLECLRKLGVAESEVAASSRSSKYTWHKPDGHLTFETCHHRKNSACNRLQDLQMRNAKQPPLSKSQWLGALVFGKTLADHGFKKSEPESEHLAIRTNFNNPSPNAVCGDEGHPSAEKMPDRALNA